MEISSNYLYFFVVVGSPPLLVTSMGLGKSDSAEFF